MEQIASFLEKMDKKPDQELLDIITVQKENYQPDALKAAVMVLKTRGVAYRAYIQKFEAEKENSRPADIHEWHQQILSEQEPELPFEGIAQAGRDDFDEVTSADEGEEYLSRLKYKKNFYTVITILFAVLSVAVISMALAGYRGMRGSIFLLISGGMTLFNRNKLSKEYQQAVAIKEQVKDELGKEYAPEVLQQVRELRQLTIDAKKDRDKWEDLVGFLEQNLQAKEHALLIIEAHKVKYYIDPLEKISTMTTNLEGHNYLMAPFHKLGIQG